MSWDVIRRGGMFQGMIIVEGQLIRSVPMPTYTAARAWAKSSLGLARRCLPPR